MQTIVSNIKIAETQVKLAQRNLRDTIYRAPFSGKLDNSLIEIGLELVAGKVLGKFMNTAALNVQFFVGENTYTHISNILGQDARVLWKKSNFKKTTQQRFFT